MLADSPPARPSADEIWRRTRAAVTAAQYPDHIAYKIAITGRDGETPVSNHYQAVFDPLSGTIRLFTLSDEQLAQPAPVPHGINVSATIVICFPPLGCWGHKIPVGHPAPYYDLLGEPFLAPTYMFGLRYALVATQPSTSPNPLPVIATLAVQAPLYRVALVDMPEIDGALTYHLQLTPLRNPKQNRLRELWVGTADYLPRKAITSGNFTIAPLVDVPWTVDFSVVNGVPYIRDEYTAQTLFLQHRRVVRDAMVMFDDLHESTTVYDMPIINPDPPKDALVEPL